MKQKRARFPWLAHGLVLVVIVVLAIAPIAGVLASSGLAEANGCVLNEGDVHACVVLGVDLGPVLYFLFVMGWLGLASIPLGAAALVAWLMTMIVHRAVWKRRSLARD